MFEMSKCNATPLVYRASDDDKHVSNFQNIYYSTSHQQLYLKYVHTQIIIAYPNFNIYYLRNMVNNMTLWYSCIIFGG